MINQNDIINACTVNGSTDWTKYREIVRKYRDAVEALKAKTAEDINAGRTPAETIKAWIASVGYETAETVMASLINFVGEYDARISGKVRKWAATIENAFSRDSSVDIPLYCSDIHSCHKDQLARAFMEYQPEEPQPTEPETAPTEPETVETETTPAPAEAVENGPSDTEEAPKEFQPGDVVRISGGYHANSNGLFFVTNCTKPGHYYLHPLTKAGKLRKASIQFWPLVSYCSDRQKNYEARRHNAEHARIEAAPEVPTCYVAEYYRQRLAETIERAEDQERRGYCYSGDTRAETDRLAAVVARFDPADVPAPAPAPAPIKFYWNGLRVNGEFLKCSLWADTDSQAVTIHGHYTHLPREFFEVVNNSDSMTDYYEDDRTTINEDHPLHRFARYAALKGIATGHSYRKLTDAQRAEWEAMKDPGQPTEADAEAARKYLADKAEAERKAREEAENERREADAARVQHQRTTGAAFIRETAEAHPIREGAPTVTIQWSEHPAFYDWNDGELVLSVAAAEIILRHFDEEQHTAREAGKDEFGPVSWCYYKTKYTINYSDPKTGEASEFTDRYDLGDNNGGLCAFIESYNGTDNPFCQLLRENTASGRITAVTVAPWVAEALSRRRERAERETSEIFSMAEMLSEEQLTAAVLRVDRTAPGAEDIARFFCQELLKRDRQKAVEVWNRWKRGETD